MATNTESNETGLDDILTHADENEVVAPHSGATHSPLGCSIDGTPGSDYGQADSEAGNRPLDDVLSSIEKREILAALRRANGQRTLAAQLLRISRSRLYRRMEALGIDPRKLGPGGEV